MPDLANTNPAAAGNTTSEHFWTKVLVICGLVGSAAGFLGDAITQALGTLPAGSPALRYAGFGGVCLASIASLAYLVSRTIVKLHLVDAQAAAAVRQPEDAAAAVLGDDGPKS